MHFGFNDEQLAVRDTVGAVLDKQCDRAALQRAWADGDASSLRPLWAELAGLGVQGLLAPEEVGGAGLDWVTMALVLAEAGRTALPLPVMETAAVAVPILAGAGDPLDLLSRIIDGSAVVTVSVQDQAAPAAGLADYFIVVSEGGASIYRRDEVELEPVQSVDRTRDLARVTPRVPGAPLGEGSGDLAALGSAALLVGLGRELVRTTVEYVKERKQFGVPVGSFQAVKHHLADATLQVSFAAPPVWAAAHAIDTGSADTARSISLAKAMASDAASLAARVALQCHGAMGYTDDYHLHLWLKRVWCLSAGWGSAGWHRDRIGRELGLSR